MSSSSSSSSEPSALESARASPPLPDVAIWSAVIIARLEPLMIPKMPELDATQSTKDPGGGERGLALRPPLVCS
jgi:hypothetical protein